MVKKVVISNISAAAGANIDLRGKIPAPIHTILSATLLAGHSVNEGGTATYDILAASSATATRVDPYTITLNVAVTTKDLLELVYVAATEYPVPT
jgi:hypothetical protein